jgi:hypothetical protein
MCTLFLNPVVSNIIQQLMNADNLILGITCWPVWIVDSYFSLFPADNKKFGASLFTVESEKTLEIIVTNNEKFICYRSGSIGTFNKDIEEQNTIRYISQTYKINPKDVAIYHVNNETIDSFTKKSSRYLHVVSNNINCKALGFSGIARKLSSCICGLFFIWMSVCAIAKYVDLNDIQNKKKCSQSVLESIDKRVMDESSLWIPLRGTYQKSPDFKKCIKEQMAYERLNTADKIMLKVDQTSDAVSVNLYANGQEQQ